MNKNIRYFNGNTALAPQYNPKEEDEYEKLRKQKNEALKKIKNRNVDSKIYIIKGVALCFVMGLAILWRFSTIYNMQSNLNVMKAEISTLNKENANLKVELVNNSSLQYIEENAVNRLHMVNPTISSVVYANLDNQLIKQTNQNNTKEGLKSSLLSKFKKFLF